MRCWQDRSVCWNRIFSKSFSVSQFSSTGYQRVFFAQSFDQVEVELNFNVEGKSERE